MGFTTEDWSEINRVRNIMNHNKVTTHIIYAKSTENGLKYKSSSFPFQLPFFFAQEGIREFEIEKSNGLPTKKIHRCKKRNNVKTGKYHKWSLKRLSRSG